MKLPLFVAAMRSNRCWSFSSHLGRPIGQRTCRTRHPNGPSTMGEVWFWLMKNLHFSYSSIPHWKIPVDFLHDLPTVLTHVSIFICVSIYHLSIHPSIRPSIHPFIHLLGSASHLANGFYHVIPPQSKKEAIPTEKYGIILDLLVVYLPLWKIYIKKEGQLGLLFPIYGTIIQMFQTTNQYHNHHIPIVVGLYPMKTTINHHY